MSEILVRRASPEDAAALTRVFASPRVIWGTLQLPYPSGEIWKTRLEPRDDSIPLVAVVDDQVIGILTLHLNPNRPRRKHAASIGMGVRDDWHGKGVGSALMQAGVDVADRWLALLRLELDVFTDNEPAIRLYKKFGFEIEGTHRRYAFRDGTYADNYSMARLREVETVTDLPTLAVGSAFTYERTFMPEDIATFAEVSGDRGAHHMTADAAGRLMAQGLLTATVPTKLGGDMNYLARELHFQFERPVWAGDTITCTLTITRLEEQEALFQLDSVWVCTNQNGKVVMSGSSVGVVRKT